MTAAETEDLFAAEGAAEVVVVDCARKDNQSATSRRSLPQATKRLIWTEGRQGVSHRRFRVVAVRGLKADHAENGGAAGGGRHI